jgi:hypothetical protein
MKPIRGPNRSIAWIWMCLREYGDLWNSWFGLVDWRERLDCRVLFQFYVSVIIVVYMNGDDEAMLYLG